MLKETFDILAEFGKESVELLKQRHIDAGQKASGNYLESLHAEIEQSEGGLRLVISGAEHSEFTDRGRGAGGFPPLSHIKQWIHDKGLAGQFDKEYKLNSFAYLISKKIAEQGTFHHRTGKTFGGVERPISEVFEEARMKKLSDKIGDSMRMTITSEIIKEFKQ